MGTGKLVLVISIGTAVGGYFGFKIQEKLMAEERA
jgi:hypothetical protein